MAIAIHGSMKQKPTTKDVGTQSELITTLAESKHRHVGTQTKQFGITLAELKRRRRQFQSLNPEDFKQP